MSVCCGLNLKLIDSNDSRNVCPLYRMEYVCLLPLMGLFSPQLRETDANLGKSSRILTGMLRR